MFNYDLIDWYSLLICFYSDCNVILTKKLMQMIAECQFKYRYNFCNQRYFNNKRNNCLLPILYCK